jgi:ArsR family transcriptional regulator
MSIRPTSALKIRPRTVESLARIFRLLADGSRLKILLTLARSVELHVKALCVLVDQTQPSVSHHLMVLRTGGLVGYRRDGHCIYYWIESPFVVQLLEKFVFEQPSL